MQSLLLCTGWVNYETERVPIYSRIPAGAGLPHTAGGAGMLTEEQERQAVKVILAFFEAWEFQPLEPWQVTFLDNLETTKYDKALEKRKTPRHVARRQAKPILAGTAETRRRFPVVRCLGR